MIWLPIALLLVLLPCLPMRLISVESIGKARDLWLLGMLALATVLAAVYTPPFAPIGLWLLWWWRGIDQLPTVVTWVGLAALWLVAQALPRSTWNIVPAGWLVVGAVAAGVLAWQWWVLRDPGAAGQGPVKIRVRKWWEPYRVLHQAAWFGQRTAAGCFFALLLPFAPWWALPVPLVGLWVTSSWVAILAALGATIVLHPMLGIGLGGASLALWAVQEATLWNFTPRGATLDGLKQRARILGLILYAMRPRARLTLRERNRAVERHFWPWGYGPRSMEQAIIKWGAFFGVDSIPLGHAHLDLLHFLFEYGVPGLAACALLGWQVWPHLAWGDPWSAAWVAGIILSLGTIPFRCPPIGLVWLVISAKLAGGL